MATTLTLEQMKQFVKNHFDDFVNERNAAVIRQNMTQDFYDHDGPGGKPAGVEGDEQMMLGMYKIMPDLRLTIEDVIAENDRVGVPQHLALDRSRIRQEDAVSWFCALAI